ncbi:hypothetical protein AOLI_G00141030 [Acnodon oligacanthus]
MTVSISSACHWTPTALPSPCPCYYCVWAAASVPQGASRRGTVRISVFTISGFVAEWNMEIQDVKGESW